MKKAKKNELKEWIKKALKKLEKNNSNVLKLKKLKDDEKILFLSQAAHMDWDWECHYDYLVTGDESLEVASSEGYFYPLSITENGKFNCPSNYILQYANLVSQSNDNSNYPYRYSLCEVAFLRAFKELNPSEYTQFKSSGTLKIVGGGICSPDSLLPSGESFIRNYLVGKQWTDNEDFVWNNIAWLPDDFGHDSQLPATLEAMGFIAAGFGRVNGGEGASNQFYYESAAYYLLGQNKGGNDKGGITFFWEANDGSRIVGHWLIELLTQGNTLNQVMAAENGYKAGLDFASPENYWYNHEPSSGSNSNDHITNYIGLNANTDLDSVNVSPTPYIYVNVSADFTLPQGIEFSSDYTSFSDGKIIQDELLSSVAGRWNATESNVNVQIGTFVDYINQVLKYESDNPNTLTTRSEHGSTDGSSGIYSFKSSPYWVGFYSSLITLKYLNHEGTRALIGAELFQIVGRSFGVERTNNNDLIQLTWEALVPSTHHDYITGTSNYNVYSGDNVSGTQGEQLKLSADTLNEGIKARNAAIKTPLINNIQIRSEAQMIVLNQTGFLRKNEIFIISKENGSDNIPPSPYVQNLGTEGKAALIIGAVGSGMTITIENSFTPTTVSEDENYYYIENEFLIAKISKSDGTVTVTDLEQDMDTVTGLNTLMKISDTSNTSTFPFEDEQFSIFTPNTVPLNLTSSEIIQSGPAICQISLTFDDIDTPNTSYTMTYTLKAVDPVLGITFSGTIPEYNSFFIRGSLYDIPNTVEYGTPYHWDFAKVTSSFYFGGVDFRASHDFFIAKNSDGKYLGGVVHGAGTNFDAPLNLNQSIIPGIPMSWTAVEDSNVFYGCIGRSVKTAYTGVMYRPDEQTVSYGYCVPSQITDPSKGKMIQMGRKFNTPLLGYAPGLQPNGKIILPREVYSQVTVEDITKKTEPIITVIKNGGFSDEKKIVVLRIYQASNDTVRLQLDFNDWLDAENLWDKEMLFTFTDAMETIEGKKSYVVIFSKISTYLWYTSRAITTLVIRY